MGKKLYVATGAYDCGKTATLEHLKDFYGYKISMEAPATVIEELGSKALGHSADRPITKICSESHLCPVCKPRKFTKLVLKKQKEIEAMAAEGSFIERGYIDAAEFFLRISGKKELPFAYKPEVEYAHVFLFDVMPSLQVPKWGKSLEERLEEAKEINKTLFGMYSNKGYDIFVVPAGSVQERAKTVHEKVLMLNRQQENT